MSLRNVSKGKIIQPKHVVLYGVEGIGKSTFAANAPKPIFMGAEDGTNHLDVERFPTPEGGLTWVDALDAVRTLTVDPHEYKTLAVDTLDWLEPLLWAHICKRDNEKSIESYGYGKGYVAALDEWRVFLSALERMSRQRGMHVVLLAHSWIRPFKNPEGEDFDRYELKLNTKAAGLIKEWAGAVLFANYETYANKDEKTKRVKGVSTGARLIYTTRTAAYDAKNRDDLPESLPLGWADFAGACEEHAPASAESLKGEIDRKARALGGDLHKQIFASMERCGDDAAKLAKLNDWVNAKITLTGGQ